jgi:hypothetical protein
MLDRKFLGGIDRQIYVHRDKERMGPLAGRSVVAQVSFFSLFFPFFRKLHLVDRLFREISPECSYQQK